MALFDYKSSTNTQSNRSYSESKKALDGQSIIYFRSSTLNLPNFTLRPLEQGRQVAFNLFFGYEDFNFESHPVFSKKYSLNGDNEEALRELFNEKLLSFLEKRDISIEGRGDQLIMYHSDIRVTPEEVTQFKQEGIQILEQFRGYY